MEKVSGGRWGAAFLAVAVASGSPISFPRDHGAHPSEPIEWWYWTGHLQGGGREYGFQLTFFRVRDFHLAHLAWSDPQEDRFVFEEKAHLALPGVAGAATGRLEVFNEDWSAREEKGTQRLRAFGRGLDLELELEPVKPPVLHGAGGISRKGSGEKEYSRYVSITRLTARGNISRGGKREALSGAVWFDHEWGPGVLPKEAVGWDWFGLQLDDGSELMLYRMRRSDGSATASSAGTFVPASGSPRTLGASEFAVRPVSTWTSPRSKATYPAVWSVSVAPLALDLRVTPLLADQELVTERSTGVTYWEGACRVEGTRRGRRVIGRAYVEMTGYAGRDVPGFATSVASPR